jgi:RNA polymerase sigma-70 factor (ECF subfamily)
MTNTSGHLIMASVDDDEFLLRQTAAGNREAFGKLVKAHQSRVIQLAARLLASPHNAEDIAQEAFLRVYRSAGKFQPKAKFSTWLYKIVVNLCHDQRRRWKFRPEPIAIDPPAAAVPNPVDLEELKASVHRAVDRLPPRQRTVLVLHRFEELSYREIAQISDLSESAVESLLVRAYANLRDALRELNNEQTEGNR